MNRHRRELLAASGGFLAALGLWWLIFVWPVGLFWAKIALASSLLAALSVLAGGPGSGQFALRPKQLVVGAAAAVVLYGIFAVGRWVLLLVFPQTQADLSSVYKPRAHASPWVIGALLLLVTGPAEEVFWRGLIQRVTVNRLGPAGGVAVASVLYASVHVWTGNGPLILAALVAGLFWGVLYQRTGNLWAPLISHALWGVMAFVLFPFA